MTFPSAPPPPSAPPSIPSTSPPPERPAHDSARSFVVTGFIAIVLTAVTVPFGLLNWIPYVGELLTEQHGVGTIAALILAVTFWVLLFAFARALQATQERDAIRRARVAIDNTSELDDPRAFVPASVPTNSLVMRRLRLLVSGAARGSESTLATRSELDHALSDVSFGPARALVWALPALGFLGTAAEMSVAVRGLSSSVGGSGGYQGLRDALVNSVIPPLGDAFGVTLFALGASVVGHLLLTWTNSREQRILLELEDVMLTATARLGPAEPAGPATLDADVVGLTNELRLVRETLARSASETARFDLGQVGRQLGSVEQLLARIGDELSRDYVLSRRPQQPGR